MSIHWQFEDCIYRGHGGNVSDEINSYKLTVTLRTTNLKTKLAYLSINEMEQFAQLSTTGCKIYTPTRLHKDSSNQFPIMSRHSAKAKLRVECSRMLELSPPPFHDPYRCMSGLH
jgi:hypothetical protein